MPTIKIMDPVTRIEGHMKVEIAIEQNQIVDARCSGTLFRGFETLLQGRQPSDAAVITQRICGVCPISHGQTAVLALENVAGWQPPTNARLLRNLTLGSNYIQSHILHFYLLAALDYVKGPDSAPWSSAWQVDMRGGLDAVSANLPKALEARRHAHEMGAVFGGKMPSSHTFVPGGFTAPVIPERIDQFQQHLSTLTTFIKNTYIPDVKAVGEVYSDYLGIGSGCKNLMAYGVFEEDNAGSSKLFKAGYIDDANTTEANHFNSSSITESVTYSWYADATNNRSLISGTTQPVYPKDGAYSWLKAPRLNNKPYEVGPLARMWINGDYHDGISVMDRHLARAQEALKVAQAMQRWLDQLDNGPVYEATYRQSSGTGIGLSEAPRGALGHWVNIQNGRIANYQVITPTCWNASPKDDGHVSGPMEQALIGIQIENPDQPIEALRVIHSFDPCLSCAVHIIRPDRKPLLIHTGCR